MSRPEAPNTPNQAARLPELDFARAVAIFLALGWHFYTPTGLAVLDALQAPGRAIGWAGVDLFFVLSGFLIGGLIFREVDRTGDFNGKRFLIRRAFKIWPVLYLYVALLVVTGRYAPMEIVPQTLLHVQNYWTTPVSHLWSLAVEEHFYVAFALLTMATGLATGKVQMVPRVLLALIGVAPLLRVLAVYWGVKPVDIQIQTQYRVDALSMGVLLAYIQVFRSELFERMASAKLLAAVVVVMGVAGVLWVSESRLLISTLGYSLTMLASAAFLLLLHRAPVFQRPAIPVRFIAWIGSYSYAIYVFQFVLYRVFEKLWSVVLKTEIPPVALLLMKYAGALIIAVAVTKLVERPLIALRNRLFPA